MARFTFPAQPARQRPDQRRRQRPARRLRRGRQSIPARREIDGTASSGLFCGQRPRYRVYFAAVFDRPLRRLRDLGGKLARPRRRRRPSDSQTPPANPATTADGRRLRQLRHPPATAPSPPGSASPSSASKTPAPTSPPKSPGRGFGAIGRRRRRRWNQRAGPDPRQRRPAPPPRHLLHGALPRLPGAADLQRRRRRLHRHGRAGPPAPRAAPSTPTSPAGTSTARRSSCSRCWRRERASEMMRSLLADADAERLPAALALRQRPEHDHGRRLRPTRCIASAAAFGAGAFDRGAALAAMVRGADRAMPQRQRRIPRAPGPGPVPGARLRPLRPRHQHPQRQLDLRQPRRGLGLGGDHARVRGRRLRDRPVRRPLAAATAPPTAPSCSRSGQLAPALQPGQRHDRAALRKRRLPSPLRQPRRRRLRRGQLRPVHLDGPAGPGRAVPRDGRAERRRRRGSTASCASSTAARAAPTPTTPCSATSRPCRRPGSTTGCGSPTAPRRRSAAALRLYRHLARRLPGNDDLGTLSSWYVFGALGLYPEVPGRRACWRSAARCSRAPRSRLPHRRRALILAAAARGDGAGRARSATPAARSAPAALPTSRRCSIDGHAYGRPWTTWCALARGATLAFRLAPQPEPPLGQLRRRAAAPPSSARAAPMPKERLHAL